VKLLVACSSLDLRHPYSATPAWWQLLKAMAEEGVELGVTTYRGEAPETPWWRAYPNPTRWEGEASAAARRAVRRLQGDPPGSASPARPARSPGQALIRRTAGAWVAPRWRGHLARILDAEPGFDALLLLSVPPNHLRGVAAHTRRRFGLPVVFYDGDTPASLPEHGGFASGFSIYQGADLSEFDAVITNSLGGADALWDLGAAVVHTVYYGADPQVYAPRRVPQDIDVLFYGHGAEYRQAELERLLVRPAAALREFRFAVRGLALGELPGVERLPYRGFHDLPGWIARSRINLIVTRSPHSRVFASSTLRPFELALMGACIVASPCLGMEEWFEPGKEILLVGSADEAIDRYRFLLSHERERRRLGAAARRRALAEHTSRHRARQLIKILADLA
jgi:hypothetical protein